ncbi:glycosyltransferase family A protein [Parvularcula marina]|uniref:Glycosyltransferase family 2 protein n=1 Tax=Parvularcula marina TaxID=2292771 RepID=A0A371RG56_9PROT|nr:glycosyltransferase family A protein [Parvularcula marina]RFB04437.1 glycosyltransferase family 2 protein [Parvularcula marina]
MTTPPFAAVITPYYKEPREVLERCMASVRAQTVPTLHFMISDGHPQEIETGPLLRHVVLDRAEEDMGNTPRAIGAAFAINSGVKMIAMLDADNWYDPHHLETAIAAAAGAGRPVDMVFGRRKFWRPDGTQMPISDEVSNRFVDTNCYVMLEGAFHYLAWWGTLPKYISQGADRAFRQYLGAQKGLVVAKLPVPTVNYECLWAPAYEAIGEIPPPGAKGFQPDDWKNWVAGMSPREREITERRIGFPLDRLEQGD